MPNSPLYKLGQKLAAQGLGDDAAYAAQIGWEGLKPMAPLVPARYGGAVLDAVRLASGGEYDSAMNPVTMGLWQRPAYEAARLLTPGETYTPQSWLGRPAAAGLNAANKLLSKIPGAATLAPGVREFASGVGGAGNLVNYLSSTSAGQLPGVRHALGLGRFFTGQTAGTAGVRAFGLQAGATAPAAAYGSYVLGDTLGSLGRLATGQTTGQEMARGRLEASGGRPVSLPGSLSNLWNIGDSMVSYFSNDGKFSPTSLVNPWTTAVGDNAAEYFRGRNLDAKIRQLQARRPAAPVGRSSLPPHVLNRLQRLARR